MFYNIDIQEKFRDNYCILWNFTSNEDKPKVFRFKKLLMGTNDSPCLAISTVHYHLDKISKENPNLEKVCQLIKTHLYVDDLLLAVNMIE